MQLKGEMSMLNVLHLQDLNITALCEKLEKKRDEAPQFFMQSPIIVDCVDLGDDAQEFDFTALKKGLLELGFIPVGVRNSPAGLSKVLGDSGWAVMRAKIAPTTASATDSNASAEAGSQASKEQQDKTETQSEQSEQHADVVADIANASQEAMPQARSITVDRPVRSGQQIYAANADMTVLAPTSAGSEIMADGSIHIYGALRGRVLAGAQGNEAARIYCQCLSAELVAIAGRYQLLDELDTPLKGKPAMIRLDGEKLIVEAI